MNRFLIITFISLTSISLLVDYSNGLSKNIQKFISIQKRKLNIEQRKNPSSQGKITIHELLRLGILEGDENQIFFKANDVQIDNKGNIYVLDAGNHRIQKYDRVGRYILTIGQKGQGPGEMIMPVGMQLDSKGNIVVFDGKLSRVSKFTPKGNFVNSFSTNFFIWDGVVDEKDNVYLHGRYNGKLIHKFNFEGQHLFSFMKEIKNKEKVDMEIEQFVNNGKLAMTSDDKIILALPFPYTLFFFDPDGKLIRRTVANVSYSMTPYIMPNGFSITRFSINGVARLTGFTVCFVTVFKDFPKNVDENFKRQFQIDPYKFLERYESYIDIFDDQGNLFIHERIGKLILGGRFDKGGNLYILESVPFSQLVKYQIDLPKR